MTYTIEILRSAQKKLSKIERKEQSRIIEAIRKLAGNPRPPGCKKLSGRPAWRIRVGSCRVLYEVQDDSLLVLVIDIGHRREIYQK